MSDLATFRAGNPRLAGGQLPARHAHPHAGGGAGRRRQAGRLRPARNRRSGSTAWPRRGWTAPTWPTTIRRRRPVRTTKPLMLEEEMQDLGCRAPLRGMGLSMLGPGAAGIRHRGATPDRTSRRSCAAKSAGARATSEPGAGSDLASLSHPRGAAGRALPGQRPQDLDLQRASVRLDLLPGPHRPDGEKARGHQLPADRHGRSRRAAAADPADQRQIGVLRNVLRECARAGRSIWWVN